MPVHLNALKQAFKCVLWGMLHPIPASAKIEIKKKALNLIKAF
jgi:hypothetical protein